MKKHNNPSINTYQLGWLLVKLVLLLALVTSCTNNHRQAPVRNLSIDPEAKNTSKTGVYEVRKSDTLYSISFRFGIDYQQLAQFNNIKQPFLIYTGQVLKLRPNKTKASPAIKSNKLQGKKINVARQQNKNKPKQVTDSKYSGKQKNSTFDGTKKVTGWQWPVKNKHWKKSSFGKDTKQGIKISGHFGEAIQAAADGKVVYSGNGLVGYGNLIIIKHSQSFLSAYAHNDTLIVRENDQVKAGQKIASMGKNDTGLTQLHFEIRYQGRPVDPLKYLPSID